MNLQMAPQNDGSPADPVGFLELATDTDYSTVVARAAVNFGSSDGSYPDVPANFGGGQTVAADVGTGLPYALTPDTQYYLRFGEEDYARIQSAVVWEYNLSPDTDNGYPAANAVAGGPIYGADRGVAAVMARALWEKGASTLFYWSSETDDEAPIANDASLTLDLEAFYGNDTSRSTSLSYPENLEPVGYEIEITATGTNNSVSITLTLPKYGSTAAGLALDDTTTAALETALESVNTGWTVTVTDSTSLVINFTKASLAAGSYTLDAKCVSTGAGTWNEWQWGTSSSPGGGTMYGGPVTVTVAGSSTEVPTATGYSNTGVYVADISPSVSFATSPVGTGVAEVFTVTHRNEVVSAGTNSMTVQISTAVTCSSPTTTTNTDGWTIGTWTAPGGGVQWQSVCTRAASFSGASSIVFSTTPSTAGTLSITLANSNSITSTAATTNTVTVTSASAPTYITSGTVATGTGNLTPTMPSHATNDILVVQINQAWAATTAPSVPGGWSAMSDVNSGLYGGLRSHQALLWKRAASGAESAPTINDNWDAAQAQIHVIRGCVTTGNPWDVIGTTGDNDGDTAMSIAGVTTTVANTLVVDFLTAFTGGSPATLGSLANAGLSSFTTHINATEIVGGEDLYRAVTSGTKATAGATGATTGTWSVGSYFITAGIKVAFKP